MFTVIRNPTLHDLRKFGWAMLAGFAVIGGVLWYFGARGSTSSYVGFLLWGAGIVLWLLALLTPAAAKPVYVVWMTAGMAIGTVMSTILLTLLFVFLLPLFSLVVRMGDPLRRKLGAATYWEKYKPHEATLERMRRPF